MKVKKRILIVFALVLALSAVMGACGSGGLETPAENAGSDAAVTEDTETSDADAGTGEKKDIKFYGKIVEYTSGEPVCAALEEKLKNKYNIESLQVDWGNLDQVIRTGISSGEPCDIYDYWPQYINTFVKDDMVLDLTPYLDADDGAWRKNFDETILALGEIDGKYYDVPIDVNFPCLLANKELFEKGGVAVPKGAYWAWDDFLAACDKLKGSGVYPFSLPTDNQKAAWIFRNGLVSLAKDEGKVEAVADGEVPATDKLYLTSLENTKNLYGKDYMYPGEGAVTLTTDESRAAFSQGKVAMAAEVAAGITSVIEELPFEGVIIPWPAMGKESVYLGGADGLFIPKNVKDPDAAVEVLKAFTEPDIMQLHSDAGMVVPIKGTTSDDPNVNILQTMVPFVSAYEYVNLDAKLNDYTNSQLLAELVLGGGAETTAKALNDILTEVKAQ